MNRTFLSTVALALSGLALGACVTRVPPSEQGRAFYQAGNYLSAADAFAEDIRQHPRSAAAWNNRAVARMRLGDLSGAIHDYNRAIELSPAAADLYFNRANALVAAGQHDFAIMDYDRALRINPTYARALFNRGTATALAGRPDAARTDWLAAIALEPDPYAKAAMRRSTGLEPSAPAAALVTPPEPAASPMALDSRALTARAISRELDGDHAAAMQDLSAALAIEPDPARREAIDSLIRRLDPPR
jgi:tetratricopeptide (TPR) repeat protein